MEGLDDCKCFENTNDARMKYLKNILVLIQFLLVGNICFVQEEKNDSLLKALPALKDSARIDCLNSLSKAYTYNHKDNAKMFAQNAIKEAEKINQKQGLAEGWVNLSWAITLAGGDLRTIENYCRKAILLLDKTNDKIE